MISPGSNFNSLIFYSIILNEIVVTKAIQKGLFLASCNDTASKFWACVSGALYQNECFILIKEGISLKALSFIYE